MSPDLLVSSLGCYQQNYMAYRLLVLNLSLLFSTLRVDKPAKLGMFILARF